MDSITSLKSNRTWALGGVALGEGGYLVCILVNMRHPLIMLQYVGGAIPIFCQFTTTASAYYGDQKSFRDNNLVSSDRSSFLYYSKSLS